jgi:hypothetical protein
VNAQELLLFTDIPCSHGEGLWQWHLHSQTVPTREVRNTNSYLAMVQVAEHSGGRAFRLSSIQVIHHSGRRAFRSLSIQVVEHSGRRAFRSFSVQITLTGQVVVLWSISGNRLRHNNTKKWLAIFWNREERLRGWLQCEQVPPSPSPPLGVEIWHSPFIYVWQQPVKLKSNELPEAHPSPELVRPTDPA